jgi:hypothetical protein
VWPYADLYPELKDYVATKDYSQYNLVHHALRAINMMAHWPRNSSNQVEVAQSAGIGFSYPDVMASDPSLAMDVNASS